MDLTYLNRDSCHEVKSAHNVDVHCRLADVVVAPGDAGLDPQEDRLLRVFGDTDVHLQGTGELHQEQPSFLEGEVCKGVLRY